MRYKKRKDWILKYVKGKKVLDLGCVQHNLDRAHRSDWLHENIKKQAKSVLGVDYLKEEVSTLNKSGYNVVWANVETMELNDKFEVIVAGDLIEHLSNPGLFLEKVSKHLLPDGLFLITTPNPINLMRLAQLNFSRKVDANKEHTCWFTPKVLNQLVERYNFKITEIDYINDTLQYYSPKKFIKWLPILVINQIYCFLFPRFSETYGYVVKRKDM